VSCLPNEVSIVRLVGALMLEQNDEWAVTRRYVTLETFLKPSPTSATIKTSTSHRSRCSDQPGLPGPQLHHALGHYPFIAEN
jgi:hypothetical protein